MLLDTYNDVSTPYSRIHYGSFIILIEKVNCDNHMSGPVQTVRVAYKVHLIGIKFWLYTDAVSM